MKRSRIIAFKIMLFIVTIPALIGRVSAQGAAPEPEMLNIVSISFNIAVLQSAEAQRDLSDVQAKFAPRQTQLQTLNNEIENLRRQLGNTATPLNDSERNAKEQALNSKQRQLQREAEDFKSESETSSQQVFQRVAQKMYAFVQEYAEQQGYSLVVERGSDTVPVVWYAAKNRDITEQVVKAYNLRAGATLPDTPGKSSSPRKPDSH
jgi:outer membrane protein